MNTITLITAIIGAACGICGTVLGIMNTYNQLQRNRVRLKVIPQNAILMEGVLRIPINFSIEVINLSDFPVTIEDVGLKLSNGQCATLCTVNSMEKPGKLPQQLLPHTSYTIYFNFDQSIQRNILSNISSAYARTQCGEIITGKSPALVHKIKS